MKKIYLVCSFLMILSVQAQKTKQDEGIKIGIKGGLNIANFQGDYDNNGIRTSVHVGLLSEIIVSDKFSIQPELMYSGQGFTDEKVGGFGRHKFDYITLPVMAKFYVMNDNLSIEAGPQVGFLVSATNQNIATDYTVKKQNIVDFGLNLGLGYELKNHVFFQGRYNLGLSNINNSATSNTFKYRNSVIQFSVGYLF
ncbi:PorT family protein [Flavobacterium amnicola]|uniref:PorT family protein n=1 Tax=Flavobacterium amnicola TaxID=2506422 RepID=A0A4Q1K5G8_9FLAO|nr:porin family protein [Flavobacterium amnicola]RXR20605.1 PorT family protein [Flavobacterium amnicola]